MNMANLFVEIFISGFQTMIWLILLVLTIFGTSFLKLGTLQKIPSISILVIALSYTFGVLFDRVWDASLKKEDRKIRGKYFKNNDVFHKKRCILFSKSKTNAEYLDYLRSRIRIARASLFNFFLIFFISLIFVFTHFSNMKYYYIYIIFIGFCGISFISLAYYAWKKISNTYYIQIQHFFNNIDENIT